MKRLIAISMVLVFMPISVFAAGDEIRVDTAVVVGTPRTISTTTAPTSYGAPVRTAPDPGSPQVAPVATSSIESNSTATASESPLQGYSSRSTNNKMPKWLWWALGIGAGIVIYQVSN